MHRDKSRKTSALWSLIGTIAISSGCGSEVVGNPVTASLATQEQDFARTFTADEDFDEGTLVGLNHDTEGELHLDIGNNVYETPYLWAPLSGLNKVVQVDTQTREILRTIDLVKNGETCINPSRTTVDAFYGVWLGCRGAGANFDDKVVHVNRFGEVDAMLHVGWAARAVALDAHDHLWVGNSLDGTVWEFETSRDATGRIAGTRCLRGEDRSGQACLAPAICLIPEPGATSPACPSVHNRLIDSNGDGVPEVANSSAGTYPYGAMVDHKGYLWIKGGRSITGRGGVSSLYQIDVRHPAGTDADHASHAYIAHYEVPVQDSEGRPLCNTMYGLTLDRRGDVWTGGSYCHDVKHFRRNADDTLTWVGSYKSGGDVLTRGVAVDRDGNIWVANSNCSLNSTGGSTCQPKGGVSQFAPDGRHQQTIFLESGDKAVKVTTGVAIDAYGFVWAMGNGSDYIMKLNPRDPQEKRVIDAGGTMYTYSDMLGTALRTITMTQQSGVWTTVVDSRSELPTWQTIAWGTRPVITPNVSVEVRCAPTRDQLTTAAWETIAANGDPIPCQSSGRYLGVRVTLNADGGTKAVLEDLTVRWRAVVD
jgi:hypothetical protein